jgi:mercuric reductase
MMPAPKGFELVILGAGSTAFAAALRAQDLGKSSVMTEERQLRGTCVNRGCLPSTSRYKDPAKLSCCAE